VCDDSQPLLLSFTAYFEKDVNWNVIIKVERKATDLRVNVKAQGYAILCQLTCEDTAVGDKQLMSATVINDIVLGRVQFCHMHLPPCDTCSLPVICVIYLSSTCYLPLMFLTSSQEYYSHLCHLPVIHLSSTCHLLVVYLSSTCGLPVIYILCIMYLLSTFLYLSSTCSVPVIYLLSTCHLTVIYCSYHLPVYLLSACHPYFNDFCITSSARLTIVPVVP